MAKVSAEKISLDAVDAASVRFQEALIAFRKELVLRGIASGLTRIRLTRIRGRQARLGVGRRSLRWAAARWKRRPGNSAAVPGLRRIWDAAPRRIGVPQRVVQRIDVLVQRRWVGQQPRRRVLRQKAAVAGIIVPGAQILQPRLGVGLLAAEAEREGRAGGLALHALVAPDGRVALPAPRFDSADAPRLAEMQHGHAERSTPC